MQRLLAMATQTEGAVTRAFKRHPRAVGIGGVTGQALNLAVDELDPRVQLARWDEFGRPTGIGIPIGKRD